MVGLLIAVLAAFALGGCSGPNPHSSESTGSRGRVPLADLPPIDVDAVLAHTRVLSSDEYEGRAPGTKGEALSVNYIVEQFKKIGLEPGNTDGTYVQRVPLVGITTDPATSLVLKKGTRTATLKFNDDVVAWTKRVVGTVSLDDTELVFVGYGVVASEYGWDDYKGLDVKGKTLVMLINDPPVSDPARPSDLDPTVFGGKAMTYYGRWTYKYEIGAQKGAAGVLIIHETDPAGYPFTVVQNKVAEQFDLVAPDKNMGRAAVEGWVTLDRGRQLLEMAGQDFDALRKQAATREFKPVPLGVTASITLHSTLRRIESQNVVARLAGSDQTLKDEYVVYSAHWDHLGIGPAVNGDPIYHGAKDNAVGVGGLIEVARAFTKLPVPPRRSILFVALTAEEQGLLGSRYYAVTPIYPLSKTLADINLDGTNVCGRTRDMTLIGYGASDLDDYARVAAAEQRRVIRPDPQPEKGFYYRSDHFSFAREGVPALDPDEGIDFVGKPEGYGKVVRDAYTDRDYHKPSDVVKSDWDLSGAAEDLQLIFGVGYRVAQADKYPNWKPGNEFKARRDAMLKP
jgi:Zn-dependent M28 family amino/carboxypeptidase